MPETAPLDDLCHVIRNGLLVLTHMDKQDLCEDLPASVLKNNLKRRAVLEGISHALDSYCVAEGSGR